MAFVFPSSPMRSFAMRGDLPEMAAAAAAAVLALCGLAGYAPAIISVCATIVLGGAFIAKGGGVVQRYAAFVAPRAISANSFGASSLAAVFVAGVLGVVLGICALAGVNPAVLVPAAALAFGVALTLDSNAVWQLHLLKRLSQPQGQAAAADIGLNETVSDRAAIQLLAGLAAAALALRALDDSRYDLVLTLVAQLVLATTLLFTGKLVGVGVAELARCFSLRG